MSPLRGPVRFTHKSGTSHFRFADIFATSAQNHTRDGHVVHVLKQDCISLLLVSQCMLRFSQCFERIRDCDCDHDWLVRLTCSAISVYSESFN